MPKLTLLALCSFASCNATDIGEVRGYTGTQQVATGEVLGYTETPQVATQQTLENGTPTVGTPQDTIIDVEFFDPVEAQEYFEGEDFKKLNNHSIYGATQMIKSNAKDQQRCKKKDHKGTGGTQKRLKYANLKREYYLDDVKYTFHTFCRTCKNKNKEKPLWKFDDRIWKRHTNFDKNVAALIEEKEKLLEDGDTKYILNNYPMTADNNENTTTKMDAEHLLDLWHGEKQRFDVQALENELNKAVARRQPAEAADAESSTTAPKAIKYNTSDGKKPRAGPPPPRQPTPTPTTSRTSQEPLTLDDVEDDGVESMYVTTERPAKTYQTSDGLPPRAGPPPARAPEGSVEPANDAVEPPLSLQRQRSFALNPSTPEKYPRSKNLPPPPPIKADTVLQPATAPAPVPAAPQQGPCWNGKRVHHKLISNGTCKTCGVKVAGPPAASNKSTKTARPGIRDVTSNGITSNNPNRRRLARSPMRRLMQDINRA